MDEETRLENDSEPDMSDYPISSDSDSAHVTCDGFNVFSLSLRLVSLDQLFLIEPKQGNASKAISQAI